MTSPQRETDMTDGEYFEAFPQFDYRMRVWCDGDPRPFIPREANPEIFDGYVLTTFVKRGDSAIRIAWIDSLLHNCGVRWTDQIAHVLTTTPDKWRKWARGMPPLKPTLPA